jgi:hypothetical protein
MQRRTVAYRLALKRTRKTVNACKHSLTKRSVRGRRVERPNGSATDFWKQRSDPSRKRVGAMVFSKQRSSP